MAIGKDRCTKILQAAMKSYFGVLTLNHTTSDEDEWITRSMLETLHADMYGFTLRAWTRFTIILGLVVGLGIGLLVGAQLWR